MELPIRCLFLGRRVPILLGVLGLFRVVGMRDRLFRLDRGRGRIVPFGFVSLFLEEGWGWKRAGNGGWGDGTS